MVGSGVGENEETGLHKSLLDLVSEGTRSVTSGDSLSASVSSELEDGSLSLGLGGDDADVGGVLDGDDDPGGELELLPSLADVDQVDT